MPRHIITAANAPSSPLHSRGVKAGQHVLVSGIVGIDPTTGRLAGDTIGAPTRQGLTNCEAVLHAGGGALADVIEVGVLLARPADFAGLNEECACRSARVDPDDSIHLRCALASVSRS